MCGHMCICVCRVGLPHVKMAPTTCVFVYVGFAPRLGVCYTVTSQWSCCLLGASRGAGKTDPDKHGCQVWRCSGRRVSLCTSHKP